MDQRQRGRRQRAPLAPLEGAEGLAEIEDARMLVEVGEALRVGRAVHRDHQTLAPAQVQQALGVVGVVMGLEDAVEAMGREALAEIDQAAVDQPTLAGALQQRATGTATQAGVGAGVATGRAIATVDRHLAGVAGAETGQEGA